MDSFSVFSSNEPIVMIHRGWRNVVIPKEGDKLSDIASQPRAGRIAVKHFGAVAEKDAKINQEFEFVNGIDPFRNKDPEVRKLVRSHVVKDATRKKAQLKQGKSKSEKRCQKRLDHTTELEKTPYSTLILRYSDICSMEDPADIDNIIEFSLPKTTPSAGLDPHPKLSPIVYHVAAMGTAMWPLEHMLRFNPISPSLWFDWALSDEVLLHALLYATCSYAGLISGTTEDRDAIFHVGKSLRLINERLEGVENVTEGLSEGTIGAVSCLALAECLRGNFEGWRIHMEGIRKMVNMKGGFSKLSLTLQLKLHRADLTGAVDSLGSPFFFSSPLLDRCTFYTGSVLTISANSHLTQLLSSISIEQSLTDSLISLSRLSLAVSQLISSRTATGIPDQISLLQATYSLRYKLVEFPDLQFADFDSPSIPDPMLDEVLRVGALLYIQATLQEFPFSAIGSRNLVHRLRASVMMIQIGNKAQGELMVWLLFMGGIEARDLEDRMWFTEQLGKLLSRLRMDTWYVVQQALESLWWIAKIHKDRCTKLWDEVAVLNLSKKTMMD